MNIYDCIIVGGGYAGLSAGIYVARYNRSVLILDKGDGRWDTNEYNQNYLGFPDGIPARLLHELGLKQALHFGALFQQDEILQIHHHKEVFLAKGKEKDYQGKTVILAMGVKDLFPQFPGFENYIGNSLFWCLTCDGYKTIGKKVMVIGHNDEAAVSAMQFLQFTPNIIVVTNDEPDNACVSQEERAILQKAEIPLYEGVIDQVIGTSGMMKQVQLSTGTTVETDLMFSRQGSIPNSHLATEMGINLDNKGYIITDNEQRTNIPFVYAAGDVTKPFAHQIITAAHEGSAAAESANYDLYSPEQKLQ